MTLFRYCLYQNDILSTAPHKMLRCLTAVNIQHIFIIKDRLMPLTLVQLTGSLGMAYKAFQENCTFDFSY